MLDVTFRVKVTILGIKYLLDMSHCEPVIMVYVFVELYEQNLTCISI